MSRIEQSDTYLLEKTEHYGDYDVTLEVIDKETIGEDIKIFNENAVYVVNITIVKDGKHYRLYNYYISVESGLENIENQIAQRIVERIPDITFSNGRFIGTIEETDKGVFVVDNKAIALDLIRRQEDSYSNKLCEIYSEYQELKGKDDKNLLLKYAATLAIHFSGHTIPDIIKSQAFEKIKQEKRNDIDPIMTYLQLDDIIRNETMGSVSDFQKRIMDMEDNYNELLKNNNIMKECSRTESIYMRIIEIIKMFFNKVNNYNNAVKKQASLQQELSGTSIFLMKKRQDINQQIRDLDGDLNFKESDEKLGVKGAAIRVYMNAIDKYKNVQGLQLYVEKLKDELEIIKNLSTIEQIKDKIYELLNESRDKDEAARKYYEEILSKERKYNPNISFATLEEHMDKLNNEGLNSYNTGRSI